MIIQLSRYLKYAKGCLENVEWPGHKAQIMGLINNSIDSEKSLTNELFESKPITVWPFSAALIATVSPT